MPTIPLCFQGCLGFRVQGVGFRAQGFTIPPSSQYSGVPVEMMMALPRDVQICLPFSFMTGCLQFSFVTRSPALFIKGA